MKELFYLFTFLPFLVACSGSEPDVTASDITLCGVNISLTGLGDDAAGFEVQLRNTTTNILFASKTDDSGMAAFSVPPGIYEASASQMRFAADNTYYIFNGTSGQITVRAAQPTAVTIEMKTAHTSQIIIKELYNGGCLADDGTTKFQNDKCIILYNNSGQAATLATLCFGAAAPANAQGTNSNYTADGRLNYEDEGFIPAWNGIWYFPEPLVMEPFSQVVVNVHGAIDNTQTISQSVNYANPDYYCMYDPESGYKNASYYPTPSELIPTSHYLKAIEFGLGNAWALSVTSPALIVFQTRDTDPAAFAHDVSRQWYDGGSATQSKLCVKVPNEWITDAVEVYSAANQNSCVKRLTADIDAGYVWLTNYQGHSLYRNVNREATLLLPENEGRLVYDYLLGDDPSGIDAEASIRNGAHIIYQDTNNSTNDFHERQACSLRN
jgi:hypothetical protein